MKKAKDIFMYSFAAVVMAMLVLFMYILIFKELPEKNRDIIYLLSGIAFGWGSMIVGYFFSTSKSSQDKSDTIAKVLDDKPTTP
jgi:uncharacterized membrane protein